MITPDGPAPVSPILGDEAAALGFPGGVQVIKMANTPGGGGRYGESWACVTDPRRLLLGWTQRLAGTHEWQIIAEPAHGSGKLAALFDVAVGRRQALTKLAELARLTIEYADAAPLDATLPPRAQAAAVVAALEGPRVGGGPYLESLEISGTAYAYRPLTLAEVEEMAEQFAAGTDGDKLTTAMGILRSVLAPEAVTALIGRLRDHGDPLDYTAVLEALSTIVGRRGMDDPEARARGLAARGYVHTIIICGVGYLHRLMSVPELTELATMSAPELEFSERVAIIWKTARLVIEAGDLAALEARMADPSDPVDLAAVTAALTEIAEIA